MNPDTLFIAALGMLTVGLMAWAWFAMVRFDDEWHGFGGFEDAHFEIGPQPAPADMPQRRR